MLEMVLYCVHLFRTKVIDMDLHWLILYLHFTLTVFMYEERRVSPAESLVSTGADLDQSTVVW